MPDRQLGWAVVGCGWVARDYVIPAIHAAANGRVVALCDRDPSRLGSLGTSDLSAVLRNPEVEAVYVATPNDQHRPGRRRLRRSRQACAVREADGDQLGRCRRHGRCLRRGRGDATAPPTTSASTRRTGISAP